MFSDADLIQEYSLVSPCCMIRACRLTLFACLILKPPIHILELIRNMYQYDTGWIHALKEDLLWLSLSGELSCSCDDLNAVDALIQSGLPFNITAALRLIGSLFI